MSLIFTKTYINNTYDDFEKALRDDIENKFNYNKRYALKYILEDRTKAIIRTKTENWCYASFNEWVRNRLEHKVYKLASNEDRVIKIKLYQLKTKDDRNLWKTETAAQINRFMELEMVKVLIIPITYAFDDDGDEDWYYLEELQMDYRGPYLPSGCVAMLTWDEDEEAENFRFIFVKYALSHEVSNCSSTSQHNAGNGYLL